MSRSPRGIGVGIAVAVLAVVAVARWRATTGRPANRAVQPPVPKRVRSPARLVTVPPDGARDVGLDSPVSVTVTDGRILDVRLVHPSTDTPGVLDSRRGSWRVVAPMLAPATTYVLTARVVDDTGMEQVRTATFETVRPSGDLSYELTPGDGDVVGVGMPIIVRFRQPVLERRRVERRLSVTSAVPIVGAWHWISDREIHFRPEHPWPAGDQVVVTANLAGLDVGDGVWATTDHRVRFAIGDAHVTTVDTARHTMTVTKNRRVVAVVPQSAGSPRYPTMSGVHVVLGKQADVLMDSATNGIPRDAPDGYYEHVVWDVAISEHGEYVHAAPWSLSAQAATTCRTAASTSARPTPRGSTRSASVAT